MNAELAALIAQRPYPMDVQLRCSHLKAMGRSPAHCLHALRNPYEPTLAMRIGSGAHSLILGGPKIVTFPGKVRRGAAWDEFAEEHADDLILSNAEANRAEAIAEAVRSNPIASRVLFQPGMVYEDTINWAWQGRKFRCTPDARGPSHLVDLKTTRDASPERFQRDAIRMAYHAQMALYGMAMEQANGHKPRSSYIVAVESNPPHAVTVLELTPRAIDAGARLCRDWFERFQACEAANNWPGYSDSIVQFDVIDDVLNDLIWGDSADTTTEESE